MSHKHNYTKYSNYSKPQTAPVVEPEVKVEEEPVVENTVIEEPVVPETPVVAPVVEEENDEIIGVVVGCEKLNVRKEPEVDADVITVIPKGAEVQVDIFGSKNGFYKVCTEAGVEGYCVEKYINID